MARRNSELSLDTYLEVSVRVKGTVVPAVHGRYHGPPEDCYPSEDACVEDISVTLNGLDITKLLSEKELSALTEELAQYQEDCDGCALENKYDEMRDDEL